MAEAALYVWAIGSGVPLSDYAGLMAEMAARCDAQGTFACPHCRCRTTHRPSCVLAGRRPYRPGMEPATSRRRRAAQP